MDRRRDDVELLRAARRDDSAFCELYARWAPELHAWFARRTASADTAAELTAETFAQALRSLRSFRGRHPGSGAAWLMGIAHNLLRGWYRERRVATEARRRAGVPVHEYAWLPEDQRRAVALRVLHERSYDEVAVALGCTAATARQRVFRGLRTMRDRLSEASP
jgi:RNA polymerase sigma-70 factor (ECF subfamily)